MSKERKKEQITAPFFIQKDYHILHMNLHLTVTNHTIITRNQPNFSVSKKPNTIKY